MTAPINRTDTVLDPSFSEGIEDLPIEELRRRRDEAVAERDYQSYLRRLIQARQDFLKAERQRRDEGAAPRSMEASVKAVLSSGPQGGSRGEALKLQLPEQDMEEAERRLGEAFGETILDQPGSMTDQQLELELAYANEAELRVSADRGAVFRVHDRLQEELKRRYVQDPSQATTTL
jgi:anti-sigma-K factor RsiG